MATAVLTPALHRSNVRTLYKAILRLHRGLPEEMKVLGDKYVQDEFRRHKDATKQEHIQRFMIEWTDYAVELSKQLSSRSLVRQSPLGRPLTPDKLDAFSNEQIFQLNELREETTARKL
ncbi:putative Succinate dehydrogenase assembly factor 3, mitochondrial [Hypsibius exemplaris]|uniref:Succinate dehydrogenase assembly factor 3 n=1 Tax=Hypsibius exemplaris TaxID=2072580 RepID=A0A1W0X5T0_HYPEX|nr:putative Succinate dehydrogenase assembly factor 3, mitochondrial [Hypsibius exemplaris]